MSFAETELYNNAVAQAIKYVSCGNSADNQHVMLRFIITFLLLNSILLAMPFRDPRGDATINYWSRYATVELSANKVRYENGEDIPLQIKIKNTGYQVIRIYPDARPNTTFQVSVSDKQGREIPQKFNPKRYDQQKHGDLVIDQQGRQVKEIILAPNESFEKQISLLNFYKLKPNQEYRVSVYFFPNRQHNLFVRSQNIVHLRLVPHKASLVANITKTGEEPLQQALSPEETVYLFLSAEIQHKWGNYLKYIELPKFITCYSTYAARYVHATQVEKTIVLREFSEFLVSEPADHLKNFRILESYPERDTQGDIAEEGRYMVKALALREKGNYQVRYKYIYTLESQDNGFWKITHVNANLFR